MNSRDPIVISVPAGRTYDLIPKHCIYSCPDKASWHFDDEGLIAFRDTQGFMDEYHHITQMVILNPQEVESSLHVPPELRSRIAGYLQDVRPRGAIEELGDFRFYILSVQAPVSLVFGKAICGRPSGWIPLRLSHLTSKGLEVTCAP